ncbi:hypothetical protein EJ02DRAFT_177996 [Clathrospora elynae]|uniref:DUF7082 domain-containing protein n=1 Tax=Clathrospora elynae TaxID=706981 RepID=A0A6A5SR82_9PLEO|nr:hypothetical protein EJ02DRAFT_177996 [Clathrospora elynae]
MSGYNKNQQYVYDSEATRSNQVRSYSGIAQPAFASQYTDAPAQLTHEPSSAEMPYIPSSTYESRGIEAHQPDSSFIDARGRHTASHTASETEITEPITPTQGTASSTVSLQLRTNYDLAANQHTFILMFGSKKCVAALQKVNYDDEWYNYVLNVEVPPFPLTNSWNPTMMLKLQIEDKMGHLRSQTDAGKFTFTDMSPNLAYQSSPEFSKKRKYSTEFGDTQDYSNSTAAKRANSLRFQAKPRSMSGAYSGAQISPLPAQSALSDAYGRSSAYDLSKQPNYASSMSQKGLYAVPSGMSMSHGDYKLPQMSPSLHSYGGYSSLAHAGRHPASTTATVLPSPSALAAPVLVRATHLAQPGSTSSMQPFNPYSMYQTKAILKIDGDLEKMSDGWTQEELHAKRRLVEFKRSQQGSTITTFFDPVAPEDRPARSICVSCIWWEEKDDYFITSVDTIYLLEQLVNVRFTVEEKNRIRRNLEGFRPLTVSKAKPDSEDFFKVIMGFPNPKPRNIEKDVKVFPWKILSHALKKIISKYSASYSSTAGIGSLPIASTSTYVPSISQATMDAHRNNSPQSVAASIASSAYTPNLTSSSLSPHLKMAAGLEGSAGHGMPVAQRTPSGQSMTQWGAPSHQMSQYPAAISQGGRGSWDYGYLNTSVATGVSPATHSLQMSRPNATPDLSQMSAEHAYQQYGENTTRV